MLLTRYVHCTVVCNSMKPTDLWLRQLIFKFTLHCIYAVLGRQSQPSDNSTQKNNQQASNQVTNNKCLLIHHIWVAIFPLSRHNQLPLSIKTSHSDILARLTKQTTSTVSFQSKQSGLVVVYCLVSSGRGFSAYSFNCVPISLQQSSSMSHYVMQQTVVINQPNHSKPLHNSASSKLQNEFL